MARLTREAMGNQAQRATPEVGTLTETISLRQRMRYLFGRKFVKVVNDSNYDIVLLFLHEDKLRTESGNITITRGADANIGAGLANFADSALGVNVSYEKVEKITVAAQACVVAVKRHFSRGERCKIHFLPECKELRVLGWRRLPHDEKQLSLWKNSLYGRSVRITLKMKDFKPVIEDVEEVPWMETPAGRAASAAVVAVLCIIISVTVAAFR